MTHLVVLVTSCHALEEEAVEVEEVAVRGVGVAAVVVGREKEEGPLTRGGTATDGVTFSF